MDELEVARKYLKLGISPETIVHPEVEEIESERDLLSPREQFRMARTSSSRRMKQTYKLPKGRLLVWSAD